MTLYESGRGEREPLDAKAVVPLDISFLSHRTQRIVSVLPRGPSRK